MAEGGADDPLPPPLRVAALARGRTHPFDLRPGASVRAALAAEFGATAVVRLRLAGTLGPVGAEDWDLAARLEAEVEQPCVVSLAPVRSRIDEPVIRRFRAGLPPPPPGESEMPEDDTLEPLPPFIDLGEVLREALALALPPFPRADGAAVAESEGEAGAPRPNPFAALAPLKGRLPGA